MSNTSWPLPCTGPAPEPISPPLAPSVTGSAAESAADPAAKPVASPAARHLTDPPPAPGATSSGPYGALPRPPAGAATPPADGRSELLAGLTPLLREWLPRQRWFAGKGRPIIGFRLVSAVELLPVTVPPDTRDLAHVIHLLLDVVQPDAPADCYQLLLGTRSSPPPALAPGVIGRVRGGPLNGLTIYDALHDPRLAGLLLDRLRNPGRAGPLRFRTEPGAAVPTGMRPRLSSAEQSNSSVIYGDALILKVFRRISPGTNPDLELSLALARTGSRRVAAPAAWFEALGLYDEPATLGLLQSYLTDSVDGWQLALRSIAAREDFTGHARALGRATAEVHTALAAALPTSALPRSRIRLLADGMTGRLGAAVRAVPELVPYADGLRDAFRDLAALGNAGQPPVAQRIHGDLHLGQALHTHARGWVLIDFEGEPARPLPERRQPQPTVQDVAGMLRSFDYAARHHNPTAADATAWADRQRAAFCAGYADHGGHDPREQPELLRAYETDKAVYEVLYEARHRPDWLPIPMSAIQRLSGRPPA